MIAPPVERGVPAPAEEVRAAARKAATRRYTSYILFTLCAVIYLLPFMRVLREGTDEGSLLVGAVRIIHGQLFAPMIRNKDRIRPDCPHHQDRENSFTTA